MTVLAFTATLFAPYAARAEEAAAAPIASAAPAPVAAAETPQATTQAATAATGESGESPLPMGPGGLGTPSPSGDGRYSYPFALPQGRGGVQPSLGLEYSLNATWGHASPGWLMGSRAIFLASGTWRNTYVENPVYALEDGRRLLELCVITAGKCSAAARAPEAFPAWAEGYRYYRPVQDTGEERFFLAPFGDYWRVQQKSGRLLEFGENRTLRAGFTLHAKATSGGFTLAWYLGRSMDGTALNERLEPVGHTNAVHYRYAQRPQEGFNAFIPTLTDIFYTPSKVDRAGADASTFAHHIRLVYESDTLQPLTLNGERMWVGDKPVRIDVASRPFVGGVQQPREHVRSYSLRYGTETFAGRTRTLEYTYLRGIQPVGRCAAALKEGPGEALGDVLACPKLPETSFTYEPSSARRGRLVTVDNGYGLRSTYTYGSTPVVGSFYGFAEYVTSVTTTNNLAVPGLAATRLKTLFTYSNPVKSKYSNPTPGLPPVEVLQGFRNIVATELDPNDVPLFRVETTNAIEPCLPQRPLVDPCTNDAAWATKVSLAGQGAPVLQEIYDQKGRLTSTTHTRYRLGGLYPQVRYRLPVQATILRAKTSGPLTVVERSFVDFEGGDAGSSQGVSVASTYRVPDPSSSVFMTKTWDYDAYANPTSVFESDCVDCGQPETPVSRETLWGRPAGDTTGFLYRPTESWTYDSSTRVPSSKRNYVKYSYDASGRPTDLSAQLEGSLPLDRSSRGVATAPGASRDGLVSLGRFLYSGNELAFVIEPGGKCQAFAYDSDYADTVTTTVSYGGTLAPKPIFTSGGQTPDTYANCGTRTLATTTFFDRGLGLPTSQISPRGERTRWTYDGFGRTTAVYPPDPVQLGQSRGIPSRVVEYYGPQATGAAYSAVRSTTAITTPALGDTEEDAVVRDTWEYFDAFGSPFATIAQANPAEGDEGSWIVASVLQRGTRGQVVRSYAPRFTNTAPGVKVPAGLAAGAFDAFEHDGFGRPTARIRRDGTYNSRIVYDTLGFTAYGPKDGAKGTSRPTVVRYNAHGWPVSSSSTYSPDAEGSTFVTDAVTYTHLPTGQIESETKTSKDGIVTRWMRYDSLGRRVLNVEPNTSKNFTADPKAAVGSLKAWRYAFDDAGRLVGTSDARGCGRNLFYDGAGRLVAEDYSPCDVNHQIYTPPNLETGAGTEALYIYDSADHPALKAAGLAPKGDFAGLLVAQLDRGAAVAWDRDALGLPVREAKRLARPREVVDVLAERYAPHVYSRELRYDSAGRALEVGTGAESGPLVDAQDKSFLRMEYSLRGAVKAVRGTFGTLVDGATYTAQGQLAARTLGDAASTTTRLQYTPLGQVARVQTTRNAPELWTNPTLQVAPAPAGDEPTRALTLQDLSVAYDAIGNPSTFTDGRPASEWPLSAQPASRSAQHDDRGQLLGITTTFPIINDPSRAATQTWSYDGKGNTTSSIASSGALGIGTIANSTTAPHRLQSARKQTGFGDSKAITDLSAGYDDAGNATSLDIVTTQTVVIIQDPRPGPNPPAPEMRPPPPRPTETVVTRLAYRYAWDEVGRLLSVDRWENYVPASPMTPDYRAEYNYDAHNSRVSKKETTRGASTWALYVFASLEHRGATFDGVTKDYVRSEATEVALLGGLGRAFYSPEVLAGNPTTKAHVFLTLADPLGSSSVILDKATGEVVEEIGYSGYGATEHDYRPTRWGSYREDYRFTSKEEDAGAGVVYFGHRYYSPLLTRWLSADPLYVHGMNGDENPYAYVGGNTLSSTDPDGRERTSEPFPCSSKAGELGWCIVTETSGIMMRASSGPFAEVYETCPDCQAVQPDPYEVSRNPGGTIYGGGGTGGGRAKNGDNAGGGGGGPGGGRRGGAGATVMLGAAAVVPLTEVEVAAGATFPDLPTIAITILAGAAAGAAIAALLEEEVIPSEEVNYPPEETSPDTPQAKGGTYQLVDPATGKVIRNGRTNDLERRQKEHARDPRFQGIDFEEVHRTDDYDTQRGLEQMQLDTQRGPMDKIRGIALSNPRIASYMAAARAYIHVKSGGRY